MSDPVPAPQGIEFYDYYKPSLPADSYLIHTEAAVDGVGATLPVQTQAFIVEAPQFTIAPADVHNVFPAANSVGQFARVLPMVVLQRRGLPWERQLTGNADAPWMALLILQDDEVIVDAASNSPLVTMSVSEFLAPESGVTKPDIDPSTIAPEVLSSQVSTIELDGDLFLAVAPRLVDLPFLAHVRSNAVADQALAATPQDPGWFSVVLANRFQASGLGPQGEGGRNHAVLVSLEGWESWLGASKPYGSGDVRLVALSYWSFGCTPATGATFADLVEHLAAPETAGADRLLLRAPLPTQPGSDPPAKEALMRISDGYVPVGSKAPSGEDTFAWYRGPFTPVAAQPEPTGAEAPASSAAAMIYDGDFGIFDHSYSAAWEIGRALAQADPAIAIALFRLRRQAGAALGRLALAAMSAPQARLASNHAVRPTNAFLAAGDGLMRGLDDQALHAWLAGLAPLALNSGGAFRPPKRRRRSGPRAADVRALAQRPDAGAALGEAVADLTPPIVNWLARLCLLESVPFSHLVPAQAMLPVESLRFFYVDENWLRTAMAGALSLGVASSRDTAVHSLLNAGLLDAALTAAAAVRVERLQLAAADSGSSGPPRFGVFIRSQLIAGWPNLQVTASLAGVPVAALRLERLDQTTLIALYDEIADTLTLAEHYQGLRFGVDDNWQLMLRNVTPPVGAPQGTAFPAQGSLMQFMRTPETGTLPPGQGERVLDIAARLVPALDAALGGVSLAASGYAIQFVQAPESISFEPTAPAGA